jgi:hypothetical protein
MPARVPRSQGKSMFVKEVLNDNPLANASAVNEAWQAAGMSGSISDSLVSNVRSRLKLAGNQRGRRRSTRSTGAADAGGAVNGSGRGRPPMQILSGANGTAQVKSKRGKADLMDLEIELDRLLMNVMEVGSLPDVENALRKARRHLYASLVPQS